MRWATWKRVGIDRMACAWLIRRFIDRDAEFIFVESGRQTPDDAVPFDIPGARFTHRRGECTFVTMVREHGLKDAALDRLGDIITAADVPGNFFDHPESAGIDAVCRGISLVSQDDHAAVAYGLVLFDGLYRLLASDS